MSNIVRDLAKAVAIGSACLLVLASAVCFFNPPGIERTIEDMIGFAASIIFFSTGTICGLLVLLIDAIKRVEYAIWNKQPMIAPPSIPVPNQRRE